MIWKSLLVVIFGLVIGVLIGYGFLVTAPILPLPNKVETFRQLGIHQTEVVGFLPYWLQSKAKDSYDSEVTTLAYFALILNPDGTIQEQVNAREQEPGWTTLHKEAVSKRLASAKDNGQKLSLVVQMSGEKSIAKLISDPEVNGKRIVAEVEPIFAQYGFSDLNVDIESFAEASPAARAQFTQLVQTISNEVDALKLGTVSLDMSPSAVVKPFIYDAVELGRIVDKVVLMAYDYHYTGSYIAGAVAPLDGIGGVAEFDVRAGLAEAMKTIPRKKIILGIPLYGYMWETLDDRAGAPTIPGSGMSMSSKIVSDLLKTCTNCGQGTEALAAEPWITYPAPDQGVTKQIFYSDERAVQGKVELAKNTQIAGVALWALGYEDETILNPIAKYKKYMWREPVLPFFDRRFLDN